MLRLAVPLLAGSLVVAAATCAPAFAGGEIAAPPPAAPPKYDVLRFREDWAPMRETPWCDRCDVTDRLKAIDLFCPPDTWVNVGGQARYRYESWSEQGFGSIPGDDSWGLLRARLHVDLHVGEHVRLFAEGIYADEDGRDAGPRPVDENHGDVQNLFLEASGPIGCAKAGVWAGRHELLFGKQRLVGPLDWANVRRTFDGVGAWIKDPAWRLDAFVVRPVLVDPDAFDDDNDEDTLFAGLHFVRPVSKEHSWEAYAYYLERERATWFKVVDEESRLTIGGSCTGTFPCSEFDYDAEAALQVGDFGDDSILAGMATGELGWKPACAWGSPRFALGADWASGGHGPGGDQNTYAQLYPTGHLWFGWADLIGRQNLIAGRLTATVKPADIVTVRVDVHRFWRASLGDAVYNAGGGVLRPAVSGGDRGVATELDVQVKVAIDRHWEIEVGWAHVMPDDFIKASGPSEDVDFLWFQVVFTF